MTEAKPPQKLLNAPIYLYIDGGTIPLVVRVPATEKRTLAQFLKDNSNATGLSIPRNKEIVEIISPDNFNLLLEEARFLKGKYWITTEPIVQADSPVGERK